MKNLTLFITLLFFFSTFLFAQEVKDKDVHEVKPHNIKIPYAPQDTGDSVTIKDNDGKALMTVTDEGDAGSIKLWNVGSSLSGNKLYNWGGNLYWGGSQLGTAGSAGGWTHSGTYIYPTTLTDFVGIGITNPTANLDIRSPAVDQTSRLRIANSDMSHNIYLSSGADGGVNPQISWRDGDDLLLRKWDGSTSTELMTIKSNGNVGIGTSSPSVNLDIRGSGTDVGGLFYLGNSNRTHILNFFSGRENDPNPFILWKDGDPLRFATDANGWVERMRITSDGKVGIGTTTPSAALHVSGNDGVLFEGTYGSGTALNLGAGTRMMWYPKRAAFRAGYVSGTQWDNANIGNYSTAMGRSTTASGYSSTAMGYSTTASGVYSTAMGDWTTASGDNSTAMGGWTTARGDYSTAMGLEIEAHGYYTVAIALSDQNGLQVTQDSTMAIMGGKVGIEEAAPTAELQVGGTDGVLFSGTFASGTIPAEGAGVRMMWYPAKAAFRAGYIKGAQWDAANVGDYSIAMGATTIASGDNSTALGAVTTASGLTSTAMGYNTVADGLSSTAMGSFIETTGDGSFAIGDNSTTSAPTFTTDNRFYARFANGYRLYTKSDLSTGVVLTPGATSWSSTSDSTKKENFQAVNGEEILTKIGDFKLKTWNYIGQDPAKFRHYGPMAQDFFAAFGHDGIGVIGCDTLLSSADFDGINFIAIQALEKRTKELKKENEELKMKNKELNDRITQIENRFAQNETLLKHVMIVLRKIEEKNVRVSAK